MTNINMAKGKNPEKRPYRMTSRAAAAEETGQRLIAAMQALFAERPYAEITIEAVAERAGVTLQTLLRRFGSKAGLLAAAAKDGAARVEAQRQEAAPGDLRDCVKNLFDHYEKWGDVSLRLLAEESLDEIAPLTNQGRKVHAAWVERSFSVELARCRGRAREIQRAQLIAVSDVYMWKLLRRDLRLSRADGEKAVMGLLEALFAKGVR